MKIFKTLAFAGLLALTSVGVSIADDGHIVRVAPSDAKGFAAQFGRVAKDISNGNGVYLVRLPSVPGAGQALRSHPLVRSVESNGKVAVPEVVTGSGAKFPLQSDPKNQGKVGAPISKISGLVQANSGGKTVTLAPSYALYMSQPGIVKINLPGSREWKGQGVRVAVIDTWVDASNTVLHDFIDTKAAFDCIANKNGGASITQETSPFIDQETSPFIDSTGTVLVNQETSPFIDQETSPFIDQETSPFIDGIAFGHGTMVAGLVHRVAHDAKLVPIRAFLNDGSGSIADVIQGIYYAADVAKVDVINMSFSAPDDSPELRAAIKHAQDKGVICVASVSNSNSPKNVYPAAEDKVIGVAATDYNDYKASFSDWGSDVNLAAPGVYMTSTYPNDSEGQQHWAMASGTSFATPLVTGAVAVLKSLPATNVEVESSAKYLDSSADPILDPAYRNKLGSGRLDVSGAVSAAKSGGN
jgi:hypothetical protein